MLTCRTVHIPEVEQQRHAAGQLKSHLRETDFFKLKPLNNCIRLNGYMLEVHWHRPKGVIDEMVYKVFSIRKDLKK